MNMAQSRVVSGLTALVHVIMPEAHSERLDRTRDLQQLCRDVNFVVIVFSSL